MLIADAVSSDSAVLYLCLVSGLALLMMVMFLTTFHALTRAECERINSTRDAQRHHDNYATALLTIDAARTAHDALQRHNAALLERDSAHEQQLTQMRATIAKYQAGLAGYVPTPWRLLVLRHSCELRHYGGEYSACIARLPRVDANVLSLDGEELIEGLQYRLAIAMPKDISTTTAEST